MAIAALLHVAALSTPSGKKLCFLPIGIAASIDLSDIGAHRQKVVSSSVTVTIPREKPLEDVKEVDHRAPWSPDDPNKVKIDRPWMHAPKKKHEED